MYIVTGRIYGEGDSSGLSKASVTELGTSNGVSTAANGSFTLVVASNLTMIKISHLGYVDRIMTAGSFNSFETLDSKSELMDEVLVNGSTTKKDNTLLYVALALTAGVVIAKVFAPKPRKVTV